MAEIDQELVERALRWCAEAGRQTTPAAVRSALSPLTWDELLAARALLADPPPARPLGPFALADVARGAPADVAAEHERAGRYAAEAVGAPDVAGAAPPAPTRAPAGRRKRARAPFVVRRASARVDPGEPAPRALPLVDELLLEEGRAVLERLMRRHGGRRARIVEALAAGWRRADGRPVDGGELDRALGRHGMARAFENRERDELLHALRAAGGVRARAAEALGLDHASLEDALDRLGARGDAERVREQRRRDLRARGTLTQRSHLVLDETERLADLGLLEEFSRDLAERLPDHVRALTAASPDPATDLLGRSLSLDRDAVERLLQQTGLTLAQLPRTAGAAPPSPERPPSRPHRDRSGPRGSGPRGDGTRPPGRGRAEDARRPGSPGRPGAGRPGAGRPGPGRPGAGRPGAGRPGAGRPGAGGPPRGKPRGPGGGRPAGRSNSPSRGPKRR